jgi:thioredoxin reductase (NADPH)
MGEAIFDSIARGHIDHYVVGTSWSGRAYELRQTLGRCAIPHSFCLAVVIVGAGPAGLSAAMYGASEGFSTLVVNEGGLGGRRPPVR